MTLDLNTLSKEQLISLVQARGQAIQFGAEADQTLFTTAGEGRLDSSAFHKFMNAKSDILAGLATAEEKILAGNISSAKLN